MEELERERGEGELVARETRQRDTELEPEAAMTGHSAGNHGNQGGKGLSVGHYVVCGWSEREGAHVLPLRMGVCVCVCRCQTHAFMLCVRVCHVHVHASSEGIKSLCTFMYAHIVQYTPCVHVHVHVQALAWRV